jgi:hypothetical protein
MINETFTEFRYVAPMEGQNEDRSVILSCIKTWWWWWEFFSPCGSRTQFWALAASTKLSVSFRLLDLGQSAGLLGRVINSSQGLCVSALGDCEDGEIGGMKWFWQGKPEYLEKTCHDATLSTSPTCQTWVWTRTAAVGSQWLTASAVVRPVMRIMFN